MTAISTPSRLAASLLETASGEERPISYTRLPYTPLASPEGRLLPVNLLVESFALAGVEVEGVALVSRIRDRLGGGRTVWGIKHRGPEHPLSWELYFYDPARRETDMDVEFVKTILEPGVHVEATVPAHVRWIMFSVEFDPEDLRTGRSVGLSFYVAGHRQAFELPADGVSWEVHPSRMAFANVYRFLDPARHMDEIVSRTRSSPHIDASTHLGQLLLPQLIDARRHICVAHKRGADALYFAGVTTAQLLQFLSARAWPASLAAFVEQHRRDLDWLLWDVGFDWCLEDGRTRFVKHGIYGYV